MTTYNPRYDQKTNLDALKGKTLVSVENHGDEQLVFTTTEGGVYVLYHEQDCCENVTIESIVGDLQDLVGEPLLLVEEVVGERDQNPPGVTPPGYQDRFTWTFYKFATRKGYVDVRWYGESNGYYSESVDFACVQAAPAKPLNRAA